MKSSLAKFADNAVTACQKFGRKIVMPALTVLTMLAASCNKPGSDQTGGTGTGGGTPTGGGGTPTGGGGGTATTPITKVMGVTDNSISFDTTGGVLTLKRLDLGNIYGGGGRFDASSNGGLTVSLRNPGTISTYMYGPTPNIKFSNALKKDPSKITAGTLEADTGTTVAMIEINGFDVSTQGFNRVLLPLCEVSSTPNSGTFGNTNQYPLNTFTPQRITNAFPASKFSKTSLNVAPNL